MVVCGVLGLVCGEVMYSGAKVQVVMMVLDVVVEDYDRTDNCAGGVVRLTVCVGHCDGGGGGYGV